MRLLVQQQTAHLVALQRRVQVLEDRLEAANVQAALRTKRKKVKKDKKAKNKKQTKEGKAMQDTQLRAQIPAAVGLPADAGTP